MDREATRESVRANMESDFLPEPSPDTLSQVDRRMAHAAEYVAYRLGQIDNKLGRLVALLDHVDQTTELVCHPGITDADLQRAYDWGYEWSAETHALCDSTVREAIASRGIALAAP